MSCNSYEALAWAEENPNTCYDCKKCQACIHIGNIKDSDSEKVFSCHYYEPTDEKCNKYLEARLCE